MNRRTRLKRAVLRDRRRGHDEDIIRENWFPGPLLVPALLRWCLAKSPYASLASVQSAAASLQEEEEGPPILAPLTGYDLFLMSRYDLDRDTP